MKRILFSVIVLPLLCVIAFAQGFSIIQLQPLIAPSDAWAGGINGAGTVACPSYPVVATQGSGWTESPIGAFDTPGIPYALGSGAVATAHGIWVDYQSNAAGYEIVFGVGNPGDPARFGIKQVVFCLEGATAIVPFPSAGIRSNGYRVRVRSNQTAGGVGTNGTASLCANAIPYNGTPVTKCIKVWLNSNASGGNFVDRFNVNNNSVRPLYVDAINGVDPAAAAQGTTISTVGTAITFSAPVTLGANNLIIVARDGSGNVLKGADNSAQVRYLTAPVSASTTATLNYPFTADLAAGSGWANNNLCGSNIGDNSIPGNGSAQKPYQSVHLAINCVQNTISGGTNPGGSGTSTQAGSGLVFYRNGQTFEETYNNNTRVGGIDYTNENVPISVLPCSSWPSAGNYACASLTGAGTLSQPFPRFDLSANPSAAGIAPTASLKFPMTGVMLSGLTIDARAFTSFIPKQSLSAHIAADGSKLNVSGYLHFHNANPGFSDASITATNSGGSTCPSPFQTMTCGWSTPEVVFTCQSVAGATCYATEMASGGILNLSGFALVRNVTNIIMPWKFAVLSELTQFAAFNYSGVQPFDLSCLQCNPSSQGWHEVEQRGHTALTETVASVNVGAKQITFVLQANDIWSIGTSVSGAFVGPGYLLDLTSPLNPVPTMPTVNGAATAGSTMTLTLSDVTGISVGDKIVAFEKSHADGFQAQIRHDATNNWGGTYAQQLSLQNFGLPILIQPGQWAGAGPMDIVGNTGTMQTLTVASVLANTPSAGLTTINWSGSPGLRAGYVGVQLGHSVDFSSGGETINTACVAGAACGQISGHENDICQASDMSQCVIGTQTIFTKAFVPGQQIVLYTSISSTLVNSVFLTVDHVVDDGHLVVTTAGTPSRAASAYGKAAQTLLFAANTMTTALQGQQFMLNPLISGTQQGAAATILVDPNNLIGANAVAGDTAKLTHGLTQYDVVAPVVSSQQAGYSMVAAIVSPTVVTLTDTTIANTGVTWAQGKTSRNFLCQACGINGGAVGQLQGGMWNFQLLQTTVTNTGFAVRNNNNLPTSGQGAGYGAFATAFVDSLIGDSPALNPNTHDGQTFSPSNNVNPGVLSVIANSFPSFTATGGSQNSLTGWRFDNVFFMSNPVPSWTLPSWATNMGTCNAIQYTECVQFTPSVAAAFAAETPINNTASCTAVTCAYLQVVRGLLNGMVPIGAPQWPWKSDGTSKSVGSVVGAQ